MPMQRTAFFVAGAVCKGSKLQEVSERSLPVWRVCNGFVTGLLFSTTHEKPKEKHIFDAEFV